MTEGEALEAIRSARLCLEALRLIGPEGYREACFQSLLCQTLGMVAEELAEAYEAIARRAAKGVIRA